MTSSWVSVGVSVIAILVTIHTVILGWFFAFVREESSKRSQAVNDLHNKIEDKFVTKELLNSQLQSLNAQIEHLVSSVSRVSSQMDVIQSTLQGMQTSQATTDAVLSQVLGKQNGSERKST